MSNENNEADKNTGSASGGDVDRVVMRPYFHEITDSEWNDMKAKKITWEEVMKNYQAPSWCAIGGEAVDPMGCWSLVGRKIKTISDCENCEFFDA